MWYRVLAVVLAALPAVCLAAPAPLPRIERRPPKFVPPGTLEDLVQIAARGGDVRRGATFLKPKYEELDELEKAYKPRRRGGVGVGPPSGGDGMEAKIYQLQRRPLRADELKSQESDLLKVAHHAIAITEVTKLFAPASPKRNGKGAKEWGTSCDEVIKGANELVSAVRSADVKGVQAAFRRMGNGCNECHSEFRE